LYAADVNRSGDATNITVLQAIDKASQNFGKTLAGQPDVEGRVRMAIGNVYKHLNLMDKAAVQLRAAQELLDKSLGTESTRALEALNAVAGIYLRVGDFDLAKASYDEGHRRSLKAFGPDAAITLNFASQRVVIAWITQDIETGIAIANACLKSPTLKRGGKNEDRGVAITNNLARLYTLQGRFAEAEEMIKTVVDYRIKKLGDKAFNTQEAYSGLADIYRQTGRLDEAETTYRNMFAAYRAVYKGDHAAVATALNNIGRIMAAKGQHKDAIKFYQEALDMTERLFGQGKYQSGTFNNNIGISLVALKQPAQALPKLLVADEIFARQLPMHHRQRQELFAALAEAYKLLGRNDDAANARAKMVQVTSVARLVR
jgi:eukaryotic-like serine/threonine-protein kinase